uniref:NAD(P)-binding protein n=1 Tax=Moniliophthora roreri TaxID=221103 RepID=A0A0W0G5I7_MONRR
MPDSSTEATIVDIAGDVAFVTGAASVAGELNETAGKTVAIAVKTDITSWDQQVAAYELGQKTFGRVDYFIANAGIAEFPWLPKFDPSTAASRPITKPNVFITEVDLIAHLHTAALAFQVFERQELNRHGFRGKLVLTSSLYGIFPSMCQPMYSASKAGIIHFMRASAQFHADKALTVNAICPSLVSTSIAPSALFQEFHDRNMLTPVELVAQQYISLLGANKDNGKAICINRNKVWEQPLEPRNAEEGFELVTALERKLGQVFGYWE